VSAEMSAQCQRTAVKPGRTTSNTASGFRLTMRFRRVPSRGVRPPKRLLTGGLLVRVQPGELWKSPAYTGLFDFGSEQGWMLWGRSWAHRPRPHAETSGPCSCIDAAPAESLHPLSRRSRTTLSLQAGLRRMVARAEGDTCEAPTLLHGQASMEDERPFRLVDLLLRAMRENARQASEAGQRRSSGAAPTRRRRRPVLTAGSA
jgi:hypothetical protein